MRSKPIMLSCFIVLVVSTVVVAVHRGLVLANKSLSDTC